MQPPRRPKLDLFVYIIDQIFEALKQAGCARLYIEKASSAHLQTVQVCFAHLLPKAGALFAVGS